MSAENTQGGTISLSANGERIALADQQVIGSGFNPNGSSQLFNVGAAGTYLVSYNVRTTAAVANGACVSKNNSSGSNCIAALQQSSAAAAQLFTGQAIVVLPANTQLNLRLMGSGSVTLQGGGGGGAGASLTAVRLQ